MNHTIFFDDIQRNQRRDDRPAAWCFGWTGDPEQINHSLDHVCDDLRKFFRLAVDANPTVLDLRWPRPENDRIVSPAGDCSLRERASSRVGLPNASDATRSLSSNVFEPKTPRRSRHGSSQPG